MDFFTILLILPLVVFGLCFLIAYICKKIRRFSHTKDLPVNYDGLRLSGRVTHIPDGDGFRFFHCPWLRRTKYKSNKDSTLYVRLAGIDAPEMPKQPFAKESKHHLTSLIKGKKIKIKVVGVDQYDRVLAFAFLPGWFSDTNVNLEMVEEGLACVYIGRDAKYDVYKKDLLSLEEKAKRGKKGMWKNPNLVTPMKYKKMHKHNVDFDV